MLDLALRGGLVVDGTGAAPWVSDVGIKDGRIVEIADAVGPAVVDIDASGRIVAPGFIDIHTHYDAQIHWDPAMSPSALYGNTTVIGGNCGFTVAPMVEGHADYITRMLARVEGMPLEALQAGLPMDWTSFGEWLDRHEGNTMLNAGFLVGHSTLRRLVMGDESLEREATADEIDEMKQLLAASIAEGALGLSSSWSTEHNDGEGRPVPSRASKLDELVALAAVVGETDGTLLEFSPGAGVFGDEEANAMIEMSLAADRPINWNAVRVDKPSDRELAEVRLASWDAARERGAAVVGLTNPDPIQSRVSIATSTLRLPEWRDFGELSHEAKMEALRDPQQRSDLDAAAERAAAVPITGPQTMPQLRATHVRNWGGLVISETFSEDNAGLEGRTVAAVAAERGTTPFETFASIVVADELRTFFWVPGLGADKTAWEFRVEYMRDHRTLIGGTDAGAHISQMCGARLPATLLASAVRDYGLLPIEEAIFYLTGSPAEFYGIADRGRVAVDHHADLVVIDLEAVDPGSIEARRDLPGGASRLYCSPSGIEQVIVNGTVVVADGRETGELPGKVLRSGTSDMTTVRPADYFTSQDVASPFEATT